jgi:uncharacterized protein GlcG (DUF336 family)
MSKKGLSLKLADAISNSVVEKCLQEKFAPVSVVVLNSEGREIVYKRMDGSPAVGIPQFAYSKANTCIAFKMSSRAFGDKYTSPSSTSISKQLSMSSMTHIADGKLAPFPGGVVIKSKVDGSILGSVGVSGATSDQDEFLAIFGVLSGNNGDIPDDEQLVTDPPSPAPGFTL